VADPDSEREQEAGVMGWLRLFGKHAAAGIVAYPLELAGIYAITTCLHA
jgi:hypothetical protein